MIMFESNNDITIETKNGSSTMNYNTRRIKRMYLFLCIYNVIFLNIISKKVFKYL